MLDALDSDQARDLARAWLDDVADPDQHAAAIVCEANGIPFFVQELVRHLRAVGAAAMSSVYQCHPFWFLSSGSSGLFDVMPWRRGGTPVTIVVCDGYVTVGKNRLDARRRPPRRERAERRHG